MLQPPKYGSIPTPALLDGDPRHYILGLLTAINVLTACETACAGAPMISLCVPCTTVGPEGSDDYDACNVCQVCRVNHDSEATMVLDGACLDPQEYGLLAGFGFALLFGVFGVFSGKLADLTNRRLLLVGACLLWSTATAAMSLCTSFEELVITRVVAGVGQAFNAPCAYPLLLQLYGPSSRSTVNGVFAVGTYLGATLSSLSLGMAQEIGWRSTSLFSGLLGALAATSLYHASSEARAAGIVEGKLCSNCCCGGNDDDDDRDERRGLSSADFNGSVSLSSRYYRSSNADDASSPSESWEESVGLLERSAGSQELNKTMRSVGCGAEDGIDGEEVSDHEAETPPSGAARHYYNEDDAARKPAGIMRTMRAMVASSPSVALLLAATSCRMAVTFTTAAYLPAYFARVFPHEKHFAAWHALALLGGGISAYLGGLVADRWQANNPAWLAWLPALGGLAAVPLLVLCLQAESFPAAMGLLAAAYAVGECWLGPGMTLLQRLLKEEPRCQSTAVAFLLLCNSLIGALAPWAIGTWFDNGTASRLRQGLEVVLGVSYGGSCICFMQLAHELVRMAAAEADAATRAYSHLPSVFPSSQDGPAPFSPTVGSAFQPISNDYPPHLQPAPVRPPPRRSTPVTATVFAGQTYAQQSSSSGVPAAAGLSTISLQDNRR